MKYIYGIPVFIIYMLALCDALRFNKRFPQTKFGQSVLSDNKPTVPGENPLEYCEAYDNTYTIKLDHVNLNPNPPMRGQNLSIEAAGHLLTDINFGAYVKLHVTYSFISLLDEVLDLCDLIKKEGLACPLGKGPINIQKDIQLPDAIPPGVYTVRTIVYSSDDEELLCLTTHVKFDF